MFIPDGAVSRIDEIRRFKLLSMSNSLINLFIRPLALKHSIVPGSWRFVCAKRPICFRLLNLHQPRSCRLSDGLQVADLAFDSRAEAIEYFPVGVYFAHAARCVSRPTSAAATLASSAGVVGYPAPIS